MSRNQPRTPSPRKSARLHLREVAQDIDNEGRDATTLQRSPDQTLRPGPRPGSKLHEIHDVDAISSPGKRMADLQLSAEPIMHLSLSSMPAGLPSTVRPLYRSLRRIATGVGVIPASVKKAARSRVTKQDNRPLRHNFYTPTLAILEIVTDVCSTARLWMSENVNEASWNALVHCPLLKLALHPAKDMLGEDENSDSDSDSDDDNDNNGSGQDAQDAEGLSVYSPVIFWDITTARPHPDCVPRHIRGDSHEAKMIDFCITVSDAHIQDAALRTFNAASSSDAIAPGTRPIGSINHTEHLPLTRRPISVSIKSKSPNGSPDKALAQLSIWAASHFERLRRLRDVKRRELGLVASEGSIPMALPLLLAIGSSWRLYFAVDSDRDIVIVDTIKLGDTDQLVGCYQVVAALRELARWTETTFRSWLLENVLLDAT
ncbi:hypothetical protein QQZ08_009163 [Neonectria magnoliae]|uniref:PD-(D/E)XK nuclease-like domain-containing protein n=1 Tax=Neonectria magnoliae TaxID=2732573 RepID=A0ABR1HQ15_9HYPO